MSVVHIAVIILNYNSEKDLQVCAEQVARQEGVHVSIILVDNASRPESVAAVRAWLAAWRPDSICGAEHEVQAWVRQHPETARHPRAVYLIKNAENRGYSAGNNVGIRLGEALKADAVMIANPDMRIEDRNYLHELSRHLFIDPKNYVAASRIVDLQGNEQNPMREASFLEELFWQRWLFRRFFKGITYVLPCPLNRPTVVPKVSGCCLLLRMDFLQQTGYLDENVFLYCEEPILSARVHAAGGRILYVPTLTAIHAHVKIEKGNNGKRMLLFIKSRKYYLKSYSGYNRWCIGLLSASYTILAGYNWLKAPVDEGHSYCAWQGEPE